MSAIKEREPELIIIGGNAFYCDRIKASGIMNVTEQPTVNGSMAVTNYCRRSSKVTLCLRYYSEESTIKPLAVFHDMLGTRATFSFSYQGYRFTGCIIQNFTAEEKEEGWLAAELTFITTDAITEEVQP